MSKNTITLSRQLNQWIATFSGPHAAEVQRAFNTTIIPTAWGTETSLKTITTEIEVRNPDCLVLIA